MKDIIQITKEAIERNQYDEIILSIDTPKKAYDVLVYLRENNSSLLIKKISRYGFLGKTLFNIAKKDKTLFQKPVKKKTKKAIINTEKWKMLVDKNIEQCVKELEVIKDKDSELFYSILAIKDDDGNLIHDKIVTYLIKRDKNNTINKEKA